MKDLLAQREAIERKKKEIETIRLQEEQDKEAVRAEARERVLSGGTSSLFGKRKERDEGTHSKSEGLSNKIPTHSLTRFKDEPASKKRKFEFDVDAAKKLAQEAEDEAVRQLEYEQASTQSQVSWRVFDSPRTE